MAKRNGMKGVDLAVGILLIIVVASAVLPGAFTEWYAGGENGTSPADDWPAMMGSIWELVPLFAVLALALHMYKKVE